MEKPKVKGEKAKGDDEEEDWWEVMDKEADKKKEEKKMKAKTKKQRRKVERQGRPKFVGALGIRGGNTGHRDIGNMDNKGNRVGITIDSAAEESVCPEGWGKHEFGTLGFGKLGRMDFRAANGSRIQHFGRRRALFKGIGKKGVLGMELQVSEVRKPLAAVWRIAEKGNRVCFGPAVEHNCGEY